MGFLVALLPHRNIHHWVEISSSSSSRVMSGFILIDDHPASSPPLRRTALASGPQLSHPPQVVHTLVQMLLDRHPLSIAQEADRGQIVIKALRVQGMWRLLLLPPLAKAVSGRRRPPRPARPRALSVVVRAVTRVMPLLPVSHRTPHLPLLPQGARIIGQALPLPLPRLPGHHLLPHLHPLEPLPRAPLPLPRTLPMAPLHRRHDLYVPHPCRRAISLLPRSACRGTTSTSRPCSTLPLAPLPFEVAASKVACVERYRSIPTAFLMRPTKINWGKCGLRRTLYPEVASMSLGLLLALQEWHHPQGGRYRRNMMMMTGSRPLQCRPRRSPELRPYSALE